MPTDTPPARPTEQTDLGTPFEVGSLELTVLGVDTYDAAGEDANYRVRLRLRKLGGDTYDFSDSVFQIVDSRGVTHDHDLSCNRCPDNIIPEGIGFTHRGTGPAEKWVYFEIASSITPTEFRFESSSFLAPSASVRIPSEPRPVVRATRETPEPTPYVSLQERVEDCLSPWDGNHDGFEDQVRPGLHNEDSMETLRTYWFATEADALDSIELYMEYQAENLYGGTVKTTAVGQLFLRTCVVVVLDPRY